MEENSQDPYAFFPEFSRISTSQQHLLQNTPLVGDTHHHHDTPSEIDAGIIPVSSPPDVFHTPPEEDLLLDNDVPHCTVNQTVDIDDESEVFLDLAGVSQLGFPENSQRVDGGGLVDKFRVLERGISVKKLKLGFDSLGNSNVVGCEQVNNDDLNIETPMVENSVSEDIEMQNAEVVQGSGLQEDPVLQKGLESGKDKGKQKHSVFDILKVLSDNSKEDVDDDDDDDDDDGHTVLEAAKLSGITFPRPSWWPDHYVSKIFNFNDDGDDGQVEKQGR